MSTLVFDIETVGDDWEDLDTVTKQSLTRWARKTARSEEEYALMSDDIKQGLGFSPLTGSVVAIGLYDLERAQGAVYYTGEASTADETIDDFVLKQRSEKEMLQDFWEGAASYSRFVTFNGRCFDVPFLIHRSAIQDIRPSCNLMEGRYPSQQKTVEHIDLQDRFSFYGAMQRKGNLHLYCRAYGVPSPKQAGVSGDDVHDLFAAGKYRDIALYNISDVAATTALYKKYTHYFV